jgi:hypothetical protein
MRECYWVDVRTPEEPGGLLIRVGRGGRDLEEQVTCVPDKVWKPLREQYTDALDYVERCAYSQTEGLEHEEVQRAADALHRIRTQLYQEVFAPALPDWRKASVLVKRDPALLHLPLAPTIASVSRQEALRFELPLDVHPHVPLAEAIQRAAQPDTWPRPHPRDLTLLVGDDIGQGGFLPARKGQLQGTVQELATGMAWAVQAWLNLEHGMKAAKSQGARVIHPFTVSDVLDSLEGQHGDCLQFIVELPPPQKGTAYLRCHEALLDLTALKDRLLTYRQQRVWNSPVQVVDLMGCHSSGPLYELFAATGVKHITSQTVSLQTGWVCAVFRRLYEERFLDGKTTFAHAWIRASLGLLPPETEGRVSQDDEPG